jgi:hypothetical protein
MMAKILALTAKNKMPKKPVDAAKIAAAKNAAVADAKASAVKPQSKPVAPKQTEKKPVAASTVRDGVTFSERGAKLFDALLAGPITRLDASKLLYGVHDRIGEAGHAIYAIARPLSGSSSEGMRGKSRTPNYVLICDRQGTRQTYRLVKRPVEKNGKNGKKTAVSTGK